MVEKLTKRVFSNQINENGETSGTALIELF